jgi:hypothetical protein
MDELKEKAQSKENPALVRGPKPKPATKWVRWSPGDLQAREQEDPWNN